MATINVLQILRAAKPNAERNAAVLDHISAVSQQRPPPSAPVDNPPPPPTPSGHKPAQLRHHNPPSNPSPTDNPHTSHRNPPSPSARAAPPISKHILSAIFSALDKPQRPNVPNYVFVENDQENHFLYGLVLPLVARLLAVSCPGVLCVVQLPRPDVTPEWAVAQSFDGYGSNGSNGSNGSKSAAPTTPSPQGTSRTPSPSDDAVGTAERKSFSPDPHPRTAELIRHADEVLSGAEAAAQKRVAERRGCENGSPPPDSVVQDHRILRLICNGFEVLTGKMPPPRYNMGTFTLASVAWEKAGVIEPQDPSKGLSMSFSNGMMTPTEGIVVTFSNGSLCLLTTRDPLPGLDALKISNCTPVVVFSFAAVGHIGVGDLTEMKSNTLSPLSTRIRACVERPNFFFVEVGHGGAISPSLSDADSASNGLVQPKPGDPKNAAEQAEGKKGDGKSTPEEQKVPVNCPPILISAVPRATPLFVNTINQTFVDAPHYEMPENGYGRDMMNDRHHSVKRESRKRGPRGKIPAVPTTSQPLPNGGKTNGVINNDDMAGPTFPAKNVTHVADIGKPPLPSVVATSQPVTTSQAENPTVSPDASSTPGHPMYNYYGYPSSHGYPRTNPQVHHAIHSHQGVHSPPVHHGHPMPSGHPGYYVAGQPSGSIHGGHAQYHHATGSYAPNGYYPMPHQPNMMHHPHEANGQWHSGVSPGPHAMPPPHHMDARRDMPIQFSSHRAVASSVHGQYSSPYYPSMQNSGHVYSTHQPNSTEGLPVASSGYHHQPSHVPQAPSDSRLPKADVRSRVPNSQSPERYQQPSASPSIGMVAASDKAGTHGPPVSRDKEHDGGNSRGAQALAAYAHQNPDRNKALEGLMRMSGANPDHANGRPGHPQRQASGAYRRRQEGDKAAHSVMASEQRTSPYASADILSSEARQLSNDVTPRANGMQPPVKARVTPHRQRRSDTTSSTSTNSQGTALMNGAITGTSHIPGHSTFSGAPPHQKRPRQR